LTSGNSESGVATSSQNNMRGGDGDDGVCSFAKECRALFAAREACLQDMVNDVYDAAVAADAGRRTDLTPLAGDRQESAVFGAQRTLLLSVRLSDMERVAQDLMRMDPEAYAKEEEEFLGAHGVSTWDGLPARLARKEGWRRGNTSVASLGDSCIVC
jgi:hypothetical protein